MAYREEVHWKLEPPSPPGHKLRFYISQEPGWIGVKGTRKEDCVVSDRAVGKRKWHQDKHS